MRSMRFPQQKQIKLKMNTTQYLLPTYNSIKGKENVRENFIASFYDDFHSTSLSSSAIKFALFLNAISKSNKVNLSSQLFTSILNDTNNSLLNARIDVNELLFFINRLSNNEKNKPEKLNWSIFNDMKVVQISFKKKKLKAQNETKFLYELKQSYNLLKVLMASSRKKLITDFSPDEIKSFAKRTSPEKTKLHRIHLQ